MRGIWAIGVSAALALGGCANMLADQALKDAQAKCAQQGKQFAQDNVDKTELLVVSAAKVSGHCVEPADAPQAPSR